ncbi:hypothetical protein ACHQM5_005639 [Ranunculus cassubicifolius]
MKFLAFLMLLALALSSPTVAVRIAHFELQDSMLALPSSNCAAQGQGCAAWNRCCPPSFCTDNFSGTCVSCAPVHEYCNGGPCCAPYVCKERAMGLKVCLPA